MPRIARAQAGENFVADGAGATADFVDGEIAADERDAVAARDLASGTSVTSMMMRSIETRPTKGQRASADQRHAGQDRFGAAAAVRLAPRG